MHIINIGGNRGDGGGLYSPPKFVKRPRF